MTLTELTPRHQRVVNQVLQGKSQREIARTLGLSVRTVETYIAQAAEAATPDGDTRDIPPMRRIFLSFAHLLRAPEPAPAGSG